MKIENFTIQPENKSKSTENREKQAEKVIKFLDRIKVNEIFDNEDTKREFIENLDFEEFQSLLMRMNGILRDIPIKNRAVAKEEILKSGLGTVNTPHDNDKEDLFKTVLETAKSMNSQKKDLKDIALLIGSSINTIHLFEDANGRTSRLFYALLTENYSEVKYNKYLTEILGKSGSKKVDINPEIINGAIKETMEKHVLRECNEETNQFIRLDHRDKDSAEKIFEQNISEDEKKEFEKIMRESQPDIIKLAFYRHVNSKEDPDKYKKKYYNDDGKLKRTHIVLKELYSNLNNNDAKSIVNDYWNLKKMYVEILIDSIANPEKYKTEDYNGQSITVKALFEQEIDRKTQDNLEKERVAQEKKVTARRLAEENKAQEQEAEKKLDNKGSYEILSIDDIREIIAIKNKLDDFVNKKNGDRYEELQKQEKIKQFGALLVTIVTNINKDLILTNEQAEKYILEKGDNFLEHFDNYRRLNEIIKYLDSLNLWETKFTTSERIIESGSDKNSESKEKLLDSEVDSFLSQSIYYTTKKGQSVRLKLFELERKGAEAIIQSFMERIFYSREMIDWRGKSVVRCESEVTPTKNNYVFEIASQDFLSLLEKNLNEITFDYDSNIKTIESNGIYVKIPDRALVHTGSAISSVE